MFRINKDAYTNGFQITFSNGWTVSVQFGKVNYISDRGNAGASEDAEIAAWDKDNNWYRFDQNNDVVKGWVKPDEVAEFITMIAAKD